MSAPPASGHRSPSPAATASASGIVWTPTLIVERRSKPRVTLVGSLGDHRMTLFRLNRAGVPLLRGVTAALLDRAAPGVPAEPNS